MDPISEDFVDNIITNMKIIGMIQKNEKLCIRKGHLQIQTESNFRNILRWINGDSRDQVIRFIKDIVRSINVITNNKEFFDIIKNRIQCEYENFELGINNLKVTYCTDPVIIVSLDNILSKLKK